METKDNRGISARLSELLRVNGMTVNALATAVGGTTAKYYKLISGKSKPDFETIFSILDKFPDVSAEWLMRGSGPMYKSEIVSTEEADQIRTENKIMQKMYKEALLSGKYKGATLSPGATNEVPMILPNKDGRMRFSLSPSCVPRPYLR